MSSTYKVPINPDDAGATKTQLRYVYCCFVDVVNFNFRWLFFLSCLTPFVGLLVVVCFLLSLNLKFCCFSQFSSDEVVTAAQHLYDMVSFYFDDLGEPLFDYTMTSRLQFPRGVLLSFGRLLYLVIIFHISKLGHPATQQEFILISRRIRRILAVLFERRSSFDVDYHLHCETEARLHGAREM